MSNIISERRINRVPDIKSYSTKELVEELQKRDGVEVKIAEPYQDVTVSVNGPAIVLTIID